MSGLKDSARVNDGVDILSCRGDAVHQTRKARAQRPDWTVCAACVRGWRKDDNAPTPVRPENMAKLHRFGIPKPNDRSGVEPFANGIPRRKVLMVLGTRNQRRLILRLDARRITPMSFENYPPIESEFGTTEISVPHKILLYKSVNGLPTKMPLLFTLTVNDVKQTVLVGENFWKWRLKTFQLENNFEKFDGFFNTIFQYLSTQKKSKRLVATHNPIFDGTTPIELFAQFYDDNFQFNPNASLEIEISAPQLQTPFKFPLIVVGDTYKVDLSSLKSGKYNYKIKTKDQQFSTSGQFEILEFNIETQTFKADYDQLLQLAIQTGGSAFLDNDFDDIMEELLNNPNYKSVQNINKKTVPLINYKLLLVLIVLSLALEWMIRKYNGLI